MNVEKTDGAEIYQKMETHRKMIKMKVLYMLKIFWLLLKVEVLVWKAFDYCIIALSHLIRHLQESFYFKIVILIGNLRNRLPYRISWLHWLLFWHYHRHILIGVACQRWMKDFYSHNSKTKWWWWFWEMGSKTPPFMKTYNRLENTC